MGVDLIVKMLPKAVGLLFNSWVEQEQKALREIWLEKVTSGNLAVVPQDKLFPLVIQLQQAQLEGASKQKLRLMAEMINGTIETKEIGSDKGVYFLRILREMSEAEVVLAASFCRNRIADLEELKKYSTSAFVQKEFVPAIYATVENFYAACARLMRTGLLLPVIRFNQVGVNYEVSPLMEELVKLCDLQTYSNHVNAEEVESVN